MNDQKITIIYILTVVISVILTWVIHEFTHWLTSESFGYETIMQLNGTSVIKAENPTELHAAIISISGPIVTVFQGLGIFVILRSRNWNKYLYPLLFTAFYMRFLAGLMNFINANDEGRVSEYLGIGTFTLPIIVSGLLFLMVYKISTKYSLNWKFQLGNYLIVMFVSTILILFDQFFGIRII